LPVLFEQTASTKLLQESDEKAVLWRFFLERVIGPGSLAFDLEKPGVLEDDKVLGNLVLRYLKCIDHFADTQMSPVRDEQVEDSQASFVP
jgi:hypothetical protein